MFIQFPYCNLAEIFQFNKILNFNLIFVINQLGHFILI